MKIEKLPAKFFPLTLYNNELARGLVHTEQWVEKMTALQAKYDAWLLAQHSAAITAAEEVTSFATSAKEE